MLGDETTSSPSVSASTPAGLKIRLKFGKSPVDEASIISPPPPGPPIPAELRSSQSEDGSKGDTGLKLKIRLPTPVAEVPATEVEPRSKRKKATEYDNQPIRHETSVPRRERRDRRFASSADMRGDDESSSSAAAGHNLRIKVPANIGRPENEDDEDDKKIVQPRATRSDRRERDRHEKEKKSKKKRRDAWASDDEDDEEDESALKLEPDEEEEEVSVGGDDSELPEDVGEMVPYTLSRPKKKREPTADGEKKSYMPLRKAISNIISNWIKLDRNGIFYEPVDENEVPTYYEVIKNPMSFMRMREKQKADMYTSLDSLLEDLKLLCQNAMTFNEEGHWVHEEAKKLLEQGTAVLESYRGRVDPAGLKPDAKKQRREQLARERAEKEAADRAAQEAELHAALNMKPSRPGPITRPRKPPPQPAEVLPPKGRLPPGLPPGAVTSTGPVPIDLRAAKQPPAGRKYAVNASAMPVPPGTTLPSTPTTSALGTYSYATYLQKGSAAKPSPASPAPPISTSYYPSAVSNYINAPTSTKLGAPPSVVPTFTPDELNEMNYRASLEAFVKASLNEEALKHVGQFLSALKHSPVSPVPLPPPAPAIPKAAKAPPAPATPPVQPPRTGGISTAVLNDIKAMDKNSAAELTLEEINSTLASLRLDGFDLSFVGASQREFDLRTRLEEISAQPVEEEKEKAELSRLTTEVELSASSAAKKTQEDSTMSPPAQTLLQTDIQTILDKNFELLATLQILHHQRSTPLPTEREIGLMYELQANLVTLSSYAQPDVLLPGYIRHLARPQFLRTAPPAPPPDKPASAASPPTAVSV